MKGTEHFVAHFIANNLALDFMNSAYGTGDEHFDWMATDNDALAWLTTAGQVSSELDTPPVGLGEIARSLRAEAGRLIETGKSERSAAPSVLNEILEAGSPVRRLESLDGKFFLVERRRDHSPASFLEPVAVAIARLLAEVDLRQVHQCEAHDCTLLFLDAAKSRRRRWCSMALCGNRMKVAAFRSRKEVQ